MMKRISFTDITLAMLLSICVTGGTTLADTEIKEGKVIISGEINAGVQQTKIDGAQQKSEEYRDLQNGFLVQDFRLKVDGVDSPYYLDLTVKNPVQENEYYRLQGGMHGRYNYEFFYDSIPHNFGSGKLLLNDVGGGRLLIGDTIQQQLEANEILRSQRLTSGGVTSTAGGALINPNDAQNQALDAGMTTIVKNLYDSANTIQFGLKREKTGFGFDYSLFENMKVWTKFTNEQRTGNRRISAGTYERYNNGNTTTTAGVGDRGHLVDFFQVAGIELPETIDYRTTTLNIGTGLYKKNWLLDAEYTFTDFGNEVDSLVWDNPFRFTSATATNAAATAPALVGTANAFNRGRSALGQLSLTPDSKSHDFSLSGSVELPLHSRFTGAISYGWITQDQAFLPYTLNTAISTIAGAAGPGFDVTNTANLPQQNLNGKVATLSQSYQLTTKPVEPLAVTLRYRYYDYNNKSDHITFPGYSAFGDSFWRTAKNDKNAAVSNEALSFTRQNADISADYQLLKSLTLMVEGFWEDWEREELRIDDTTEFGGGGGFIFSPTRSAKLKGNYRYAKRTVDGYKTGNTKENPEAVGLANYDWAERTRNQADLKLQVTPLESLTVGLSGRYQKDEFGEDNRFGLKENKSMIGAIDVTYTMSESLSFYANYVRESRKGSMQSGAKDDAFDNLATPAINETTIGAFNPENYWNTDIDEDVDTVGVGMTVQIIPNKLTLNAGYSFSLSKMDFDTVNPNGAVKLANAAAQSWPTVENRYQEFKADLGYNFTANLKGGITYLYEKYTLDDFANTPAYMAGASAENSSKYLFTGANNYNYEAHVGGVYLSYKF
ncbi:MAG: MtrB/PioB family decaheme-associated outer membrane protein [Syntrophales bacterium]|nr:MtrB/PioB family decaheme-associated outer membrane protein [Syntrophales bacterium]